MKNQSSKLARVRKEKGYTQEQLAQRIGETRNRVSAWENGKESPWVRQMFRLADTLQTDHQTLVEEPICNYADVPKGVNELIIELSGQYDAFEIDVQFRWEEDRLFQADHIGDRIFIDDGNPCVNEITNIPVYAYSIMNTTEYNNTVAGTSHNCTAYRMKEERILVLLIWPGDVTRDMIPMKYDNNSYYPHY